MLGGTISSYHDGGTIRLDKTSFVKSFLLESNYPHEFVFPEFDTYYSEDATPYMYREALKKIVENVRKSDFDGILITHGTDTCAYFAQLAYRVLLPLGIPFAVTGSVNSPDADPEEASGNIAYAVQMIEEGRSGVVFRNRSGEVQLYRADLIISPDIYGFYDEYADGITPSEFDSEAFLDCAKLPEILVIPAVPGAVIPDKGFDRVLICCNHSGTASVDLVPLVRKWTAEGIRCYMAPIPVNGGVYESREKLRNAGAIELPGMPIEGAWAEVLLR
jgi:L-asparaginase/Glu-tRNA(Gln) amidotransferase subunit D